MLYFRTNTITSLEEISATTILLGPFEGILLNDPNRVDSLTPNTMK